MSEQKVSPVTVDMTFAEVLVAMRDKFGDEDRNKLHVKYARPDTDVKMSGIRHGTIVGGAIKMLRCIVAHGGTPEEVERSMTYFQVCIDAKKYNLDTQKCYKEMDMHDLMQKYGAYEHEEDDEDD